MGHVRERRAEILLEETLLDWLEDGYLPTTGELEEAYAEAEKTHGDLVRSRLRQVALPERWSESSASQYNSIISAVESDLDVTLRSLVDLSNLGISKLGEWSSRSRALDVRIANLKSRIESLILLKSDAAGYVSFVEDGFLSLEKVSSDTTASIDTTVGDVTLNVDRTDGDGEFLGTQIDLKSAQVTFALIEGANVRFQANPEGSSLGNVVTDELTRWGNEVNTLRPSVFRTSSTSGKPIMGELKIDLNSAKNVSKLLLLTSDAAAGDNSIIVAQYSVDGYTWENVPSESPVQSGTSNFVWRFERTEMRWVKFIISKSSPDISMTVNHVYDFGFDRVKIYSETYQVTTDGVEVVSEDLTPVLGGQNVAFGRASLEVCEEVPEETSLRYYLRANDGSSYTEWVQVSPLARDIESVPAVIDFAAPTEVTSGDLTTVFDSSINTEALNIMRLDGAGDLSYRFGGADEAVANFYISQTDNLLTDLILLRNMGYSAAKYPLVSSDLLVGDIQCGWGLDGDSIYYCVFLVKRPSGREIDLGPSQAVIDGSVVSGIVKLSAGWHTFRTDRANWAPLSGVVDDAPTTEAGLKAIDPLYPYNHKYLIEGYNYPEDWTGDKRPYLGVDQYGQYKASRVGRHSFRNSSVDQSIYVLDVIDGPKSVILVKFDSSRPNHANERVRLFYTRRFDSFESIQFKASLKGVVEKTPVLSYYRVRVK